MKRICIVTATRAEYGLLTPLIRCVAGDDELELDLIVTGTHLSRRFGYTVDDIKNDGFEITHKIDILDDDNSPYGVSVTMSNALRGFAECFRDDRPDIVVILGDRTEMLGVAAAALNERIPVAHIHGGEVTEGAVDDCIRHAITKMSYLHFTSTEEYRLRVIRMGEAPERVFNVGALGVENVLNNELMSENELRTNLCIPENVKYAVVTYHPVTMENDTVGTQINELCAEMDKRKDVYFVITSANADWGGIKANELLIEFATNHQNATFVWNLGTRRYLSAIKYASFVIGNSSSGVIEAPALGVPTVNIGDRQKGRIKPKTVIDCIAESKAISNAIDEAMTMGNKVSYVYGEGNTSNRICSILKDSLISGEMNLKKGFYEGMDL